MTAVGPLTDIVLVWVALSAAAEAPRYQALWAKMLGPPVMRRMTLRKAALLWAPGPYLEATVIVPDSWSCDEDSMSYFSYVIKLAPYPGRRVARNGRHFGWGEGFLARQLHPFRVVTDLLLPAKA
jgi:hypothetical protein